MNWKNVASGFYSKKDEGLGDHNYCRNPTTQSPSDKQYDIWCFTGNVAAPTIRQCRPLLISVKDKKLSYWSDIQEINGGPAIIYFILHVHVYKGHDFKYPTKITIRGCDNEANVASNPYALKEVDTPYKKTDNCECASVAYSTVTNKSPFTDHHACA